MSDFTLSLVQPNLHWHQPEANRAMLAALLEAAFDGTAITDLIVLPEMFTTGFTMEATAQAEATAGPTLAWMQALAARYDAAVTGSVLVGEADHYYNRLLWVRPDGSYASYDKRHLFRLAGEHEVFTAGREPLVEEWRGWRVRPLICYDLRFPVWSRNTQLHPYDLLLYVANWPQVREDAWTTLLRARAIENLSYVVGVNRLGDDGHGHPHSGQSAIIDMQGRYLAQAGNRQTVLTRTLHHDALQQFREKMPALLDGDEFQLKH